MALMLRLRSFGSSNLSPKTAAQRLAALPAEVLTAIAAAAPRDAQRALLDTLIIQWAQTSSFWSSLESTLGGTMTLNLPSRMTANGCRKVIAVLKAFNGSLFHEVGAKNQALRMQCQFETCSI